MSSPPDRHDTESAFRDLYESTYVDLVRFAQRRMHPSHAEDVVAEAYLVAWRRFADLPTCPEDARAWLFGIVRHTLLNDRRGSTRRQALTIRIADARLPTRDYEHADLVARRVDLVAAWQRLSSVHQEALALSVWEGLTAPQAARVLDISPVAFRLRLSRARRALALHLDHLPRPADAVCGSPERTTP